MRELVLETSDLILEFLNGGDKKFINVVQDNDHFSARDLLDD
jgi:hypothetical protein